jgi:hypothetical protein
MLDQGAKRRARTSAGLSCEQIATVAKSHTDPAALGPLYLVVMREVKQAVVSALDVVLPGAGS